METAIDPVLRGLAFEATEGEPTNPNVFTSDHRRHAGEAAMRRAMVLSGGDTLAGIHLFNEAMDDAQAHKPVIHLMTGSSTVKCGASMRDRNHPDGWDLGDVDPDGFKVSCSDCLPRQ